MAGEHISHEPRDWHVTAAASAGCGEKWLEDDEHNTASNFDVASSSADVWLGMGMSMNGI